ncbi:MAG: hypothetical protein U1F00_19020 [Rhodoferax sp.]
MRAAPVRAADLRDTAVTRHDVLAPLQDMFIAEGPDAQPAGAVCWRGSTGWATQHAALLACLQRPPSAVRCWI